ncbi:MAG: hypothetical protein ACLFRK_00260 [Candidatus Nanohaloarchaea archaeon]
MDKMLEMVVAAAVIIAIASIAAYMVSSEASSFDEVIGGQTNSSQCQLYQGSNQEEYYANNCQEVTGEPFTSEDGSISCGSDKEPCPTSTGGMECVSDCSAP